MNYNKNYSVDIDGHTVAVFDTIEAAKEYIHSCWWLAMATIYDHEKKDIVLTEVRI